MKQPVKGTITILVILGFFGLSLVAWVHILRWVDAFVRWVVT